MQTPADKATHAAHLLIEAGDPKMHAKFGGDQKVHDAINPPGLMPYRTALGTELVDENGKRISYRTFKSTLRRAVQFLDSYYATIRVSDRFQPGQQLGPLVLQSIGRFVHTLEDAGDEPAQYAEAVAEYVLKHTAEIIQENATTISARLKGVVPASPSASSRKSQACPTAAATSGSRARSPAVHPASARPDKRLLWGSDATSTTPVDWCTHADWS